MMPIIHKVYRFSLAEEYCTKALEIGLISNPNNKSKALFRRSKADGISVKSLMRLKIFALQPLKPDDATIQADVLETERLLALTEKELAAYIAGQPKAPAMMSFQDGLALSSQLDKAPTFHGYEGHHAPDVLVCPQLRKASSLKLSYSVQCVLCPR